MLGISYMTTIYMYMLLPWLIIQGLWLIQMPTYSGVHVCTCIIMITHVMWLLCPKLIEQIMHCLCNACSTLHVGYIHIHMYYCIL